MNTENLNNETLETEVIDEMQDRISSDYFESVNEEQSVFEAGLEDCEDPDVDMDESDITEQTQRFLKSRGKK